ncbi:hypothetical protein PCIT_a2610 [Pseudoalteromonas citrea]|uniref:Uncharacterized protein n=1 Tax=Pseudoalteromonas citrea TaxID=43655 RepID=A0AAD4FRB3_9GAMM|nr:hypothetical protein PCIT_a2610 [Pseudoalteromonas citrea]
MCFVINPREAFDFFAPSSTAQGKNYVKQSEIKYQYNTNSDTPSR